MTASHPPLTSLWPTLALAASLLACDVGVIPPPPLDVDGGADPDGVCGPYTCESGETCIDDRCVTEQQVRSCRALIDTLIECDCYASYDRGQLESTCYRILGLGSITETTFESCGRLAGALPEEMPSVDSDVCRATLGETCELWLTEPPPDACISGTTCGDSPSSFVSCGPLGCCMRTCSSDADCAGLGPAPEPYMAAECVVDVCLWTGCRGRLDGVEEDCPAGLTCEWSYAACMP